jgi:hypothetical protein
MRTRLLVVVSSVGMLLAAPLWAHHAFSAEFDVNRPIKLKGTVTQWELVNPHSWIHLDVKNEDGTVTNWMIEGGSPNALLRLGVTKRSLPGKRSPRTRLRGNNPHTWAAGLRNPHTGSLV